MGSRWIARVVCGVLLAGGLVALAPRAVAEQHDSEAEEEEEEVPASRMSVSEHAFGTDVVDREVVGRGERFEEGTQVVFWTRVVGGEAGDRVHHVWLLGDEEVVSIGLSIGGPHWRTHSRKRLHEGSVGTWRAEVRDQEGNVLAHGTFECVPAEP